jgi:2-polyprenyl-3-methyl-5-hydroxy-6-metoxy-1,4-benzoquinol methylase
MPKIKSILKRWLSFAAARLPGHRHRRARRRWDGFWVDPQPSHGWLDRGVASEIRDALTDGWFPPAGNVLDVGCGDGDVARWFADRGYTVHATDISPVVIDRARERFGNADGRLTFAAQDICRRRPDGGPFDIVVDCGCFHQQGVYDKDSFARHIADVCRPGARFMLFIKAFRGELGRDDPDEQSLKTAWVEQSLGAAFTIDRVAFTYIDRHRGARPGEELPGLVFRLTRKAV